MRRNLWFGSTTERRLATAGASPVLVAVGLLLGSLCTQSVARGAVIRVAVASNFTATATALAEQFETSTGHRVVLVSGSTGKHFAQIINGAPFDILLAADELRPTRLEEQGYGVAGSRFTYAFGRLVLWSPRAGWFETGEQVLEKGEFHRLSIANPKLAPFGQAALQTLETLNLWISLENSVVRGENVGQALHFVVSGNADLGFVSLSQVISIDPILDRGSRWVVPQSYYNPIRQQALLLADIPPARAFLDLIRSDQGGSIIRQFGYGLP